EEAADAPRGEGLEDPAVGPGHGLLVAGRLPREQGGGRLAAGDRLGEAAREGPLERGARRGLVRGCLRGAHRDSPSLPPSCPKGQAEGGEVANKMRGPQKN